jgi:hypothetical protein
MSLEDTESRELRDAFAAVAETAVPREDCPEPEMLWDAVQGELPPDELKEVVDHTARCAVCAESWRLAVELTGETGVAEVGDDTETTNDLAAREVDDDGFWGSWLQVAALVVVLAGAGWVVRNTDWLPGATGPDTAVRSGEDTGITALTPQNQALSRDGLTLRWTAPTPTPSRSGVGEGDLRYEVEVTWVAEPASTVVFHARDLERTELAVPPEALADLPADAVILWTVTARLDGERVDRKTFNFRLR